MREKPTPERVGNAIPAEVKVIAGDFRRRILDIADDFSYRLAMQAAMALVNAPSEPKESFPSALPNPILARRQRVRGIVESAKMDKTIVVRRDSLKEHPKYKKRVTSATKYYVHDEFNIAKAGDTVRIVESRPRSKTKRFVLEAIIQERAGVRAARPFNPKWLQKPPLVLLTIPEMRRGMSQELVVGHSYVVDIQLQLEQILLFEGHSSAKEGESGEMMDSKTNQRGVELELRFVSDLLAIEPKTALIKTFHGEPKLETSSLRLKPLQIGTADFYLSILSRRSGEVIQFQYFEFEIREARDSVDAS